MDDDDDRGDTSFNSVYYSQLLFPLYTSASRVLCPVQSIQSVIQATMKRDDRPVNSE